MPETAEQYQARFASYVDGHDPIGMQREAPNTLERLIKGVPEEKLKLRPAPGKWSVIEILAHLAEDELSGSWRYRQILQYERPLLLGFDQDLWARIGDYGSWSAQEALEMFRLLRNANLRMFTQLTPEQWQRHGVHSERGRMTVQELCRHMAAHDVNHIEQVKRILGR